MEAKILNVYNNEALPGRGLKGSHGEAFLIAVGERKVLLDTGWKPRVFRHNMSRLGINPDEIAKLVISHGHRDHSGGLMAFLQSRTSSQPIPIIAHPQVRETKALKVGWTHLPIGFPRLSSTLEAKMEFHLSARPDNRWVSGSFD